jgi:hypothetical protein
MVNLDTANLLLSALLERLMADAKSDKPQFGAAVSSAERSALGLALEHLGTRAGSNPVILPAEKRAASEPSSLNASLSESSPHLETQTAKGDFQINIAALGEKPHPSHLVCIDFGTAKSKAFARRVNESDITGEDLLELGLGRIDGDLDNSPYTVASSVWVSDDGKMFAGSHAIRRSSDYSFDGKPRKRLDSVKQQLSHAAHMNQIHEPLSSALNPTLQPLSFGDAICFFLAYLIDLIGTDLESRYGLSRYLPKRFTVPAWSDDQREWANLTLGRFLKRAHILADTFHGRWNEGVPVEEVRMANSLAKLHEEQLGHLLDVQLEESPLGISEPIAAGSARLSTDRNIRNMVLVVDVGAGTTDFALFLVPQGPGGGIAFPLRPSEAVKFAGDRVDDLLVHFILSKMNGHPDTETRDRVAAQIRLLNLRTSKRRLFEEQIIEINLVTDERVIIDLAEFLESDGVKSFAKMLEERLSGFLAAVHPSFGPATQDALILLTGGGAKLPFVADLAKRTWKIGETSFRFRLPKRAFPDVIEDFGDAFLNEYGQLAVAIGGTLPLINEKKTIKGEWAGGAPSPGKLERFPLRGV